jgi:uncharacterized protein YaaN involved in tellurite resistance
MNSYMQQPPVTETYRGDYSGISRKELNFDRLEQFKYAIEQHVQMLTTQVQTLTSHANWIEPRLNDYHKFNQWMEQAHPDIINAYKKSTAVVEKLERAIDENHGEVMAETSA